MSDPALRIEADHLTVDGLEHILEGGDTGGELSPDHSVTPGDLAGDIWTLDDAMRHLRITKRTVLRKLKSGELTGYKVPGIFGQEWRIYPGDKGDDKSSVMSPPSASPGDLSMSPPETALVYELRRQVNELRVENVSLQKELQAASWRNGYLESQVETQHSQIKLLTDSQHNSGHLQRFWKWFTGR
jgi:hypothetical protein|nr:helix-turn-helix domain-containing protein [Nitrosomonas nitrosa]